MDVILLIGRILFGGFFVMNGINHFKNHSTLTQYASSKRVPSPGASVTVGGVFILLGGLSVLLGIWTKVGLPLILVFLAAVTPKMHNYWAVTDANQRLADQTNFMKNLALFGAALIMTGLPAPWPYSLGR